MRLQGFRSLSDECCLFSQIVALSQVKLFSQRGALSPHVKHHRWLHVRKSPRDEIRLDLKHSRTSISSQRQRALDVLPHPLLLFFRLFELISPPLFAVFLLLFSQRAALSPNIHMHRVNSRARQPYENTAKTPTAVQ